ncbi:MAG: acetylornithine deacetylase [Crocinitomix sp.]|jgi:acetylornithine deacetylase
MNLTNKAVNLLMDLIQLPSFSGDENATAEELLSWFKAQGVEPNRFKNNIWATNKHFDEHRPTILLNSHHDTVKPNKGYTNDPFDANCKHGKLYGLGSNDAGGSLVSLMVLFVHFYEQKNLNYNLIIAATAEEENSGSNGIKSLLPILPKVDFALVGEPTEMQLAIAEKGLLVIDCYANGIAGHAAHDNTENAIYKAMEDIEWIKTFEFQEKSDFLGGVKMSVTQIKAGEQHNLVPAVCHFVIDVRVNECYTNEEVFQCIDANTNSTLKARSFNLNSSSIPVEHPIVKAGISLGRQVYGSPTLSDQANLNCPSLKLGPGKSSRSHSANEFIYIKEIEEGIALYINLFNNLLKNKKNETLG